VLWIRVRDWEPFSSEYGSTRTFYRYTNKQVQCYGSVSTWIRISFFSWIWIEIRNRFMRAQNICLIFFFRGTFRTCWLCLQKFLMEHGSGSGSMMASALRLHAGWIRIRNTIIQIREMLQVKHVILLNKL
jgi:hypothetical protein